MTPSFSNPDNEQMVRERVLSDDQHWAMNNLSMSHANPASHQISSLSILTHAMPEEELAKLRARFGRERQAVYMKFPSQPYQGARNGSFQPHEVLFCRTNGDVFSVKDALSKNCDDLLRAESYALPDGVPAKVSLRLHFQGHHPYTRQIMARRSTAKGEPISMKVMAQKIAEEVRKYLAEIQAKDEQLRYGSANVEFDHLYLHRLYRVSPGSWDVEFGVFVLI